MWQNLSLCDINSRFEVKISNLSSTCKCSTVSTFRILHQNLTHSSCSPPLQCSQSSNLFLTPLIMQSCSQRCWDQSNGHFQGSHLRLCECLQIVWGSLDLWRTHTVTGRTCKLTYRMIFYPWLGGVPQSPASLVNRSSFSTDSRLLYFFLRIKRQMGGGRQIKRLQLAKASHNKAL